jgi:hypothetical protein
VPSAATSSGEVDTDTALRAPAGDRQEDRQRCTIAMVDLHTGLTHLTDTRRR